MAEPRLATQPPHVSAAETWRFLHLCRPPLWSLARTDVRALGGRVKPGHDVCWFKKFEFHSDVGFEFWVARS